MTRSLQEFFLVYLQREFDVLRKYIISIPNVVVLDKGRVMKVYISCFSIDKNKDYNYDEVLCCLNANKKKIRFMFGKKMADKVKFIPSMMFFLDDTQKEIERINLLFGDKI
ncbi:MAG: ribosome-binding factor A [Cytophagales bacterium]|nr:ribosome-binding factor A [Cytophagales bacterium]